MAEGGARAEARKEMEFGDGNTAPVFLFLLIVPILIVSYATFSLYSSYAAKPDNNDAMLPVEEVPIPQPPAEISEAAEQKEIESVVPVYSQPNCTITEYVLEVVKEVAQELRVKRLSCSPADVHGEEDEHNASSLASNNNRVPEAKGSFVIYIAVGLLLTSLIAAFVDVYKVKGRPSKTKPQLTKRCSLADLTVLRHSRRESMRKDSIVDEQRGPPKLLVPGTRSLPEHRRCSIPAYPGEYGYGYVAPNQASRKASLDCYDEVYSYDCHHNRVVRLIRRF